MSILKILPVRTFYSFHLGFMVLGFLFVLIPFDLSVGFRFLIITLVYNVIIALYAFSHQEVQTKYLYGVCLSILMIIPDWILSELEVLEFYPTDIPAIGPVPIFMGFLWILPINLIIYSTYVLSKYVSLLLANLMSTTMFLLSSEFYAHLLGLWFAKNVILIGDTALYILPVELLFGYLVFRCSVWVEESSKYKIILLSILTMIVYAGTASLLALLL
ncbi:MAG: hypothetical protein INQ03_10310 [Candidatus Heimdallarchaeota archaeon]|nr:hypothetical protein [Candidatus Heimdallarchaeota archaeon]